MDEVRFRYDSLRTAQAAAWLLHRHGGSLTRLVLLKLLYLADRLALLEAGEPLTGDAMVSMDQGPVLSETYDLIKDRPGNPRAVDAWQRYVQNGPRIWVQAAQPSPKPGSPQERQIYDRLSRHDLAVLEEVERRYGGLSADRLSDITHELPEWVDPHGSSLPIDPVTILEAEHVEGPRIEEIAATARETRWLREVLGAE
jgi:uncharacterized phage-associated protein